MDENTTVALKLATENGFNTVKYVGKWSNFALFEAHLESSTETDMLFIGMPQFILVDGSGRARGAKADEIYDIMGMSTNSDGMTDTLITEPLQSRL